MCGIFFSLINQPNIEFKSEDIDFELVKKRGPDSFDIKMIKINEKSQLVFGSSVLSLRGGMRKQVTKQPLYSVDTGNILLWNGEIFSSDLVNVGDDENDGQNLLANLSEKDMNEKKIFEIFESIKGPYAFVFYDALTNSIYFGRDKLGRRSLLISLNKQNLMLSSVKIKLEKNSLININVFEELNANGIYKINLNKANDDVLQLCLFQWRNLKFENTNTTTNDNNNNFAYLESIKIDNELYLNDKINPFNDEIDLEKNNKDENFEVIVDSFFQILKGSVMKRVKSIPNYCKMCSHLHDLIKFNDEKSTNNFKCKHAKLAILFSGGVDSTVLAALADLCLPPDEEIDLLNIAFEKQKKAKISNKHIKPNQDEEENEILKLNEMNFEEQDPKNDEFLVPDRISGMKSFDELNKNRKWNFVEINVTLEELRHERETLIKNLLYPHVTVLDDSIGCALWFASRGHGFVRDENKLKVPYKSNAEVLLLGMGADEQLGGYARHRTRYEKEGIISLCNELKMEMKRISERNLGRDDRIISDHGKESRLPYLDEDLISFLNQLNIYQKCNMDMPKGKGEKYLLRYLASSRLNLNFASQLPKRAIQFGSRVAKIENMKEKGSDICDRIKSSFNDE